MVQEFQVLRCFSCHTFQVHQVKKSKKWVCKLCGENQSVIKVYGQGSAADCRHHVQKLNLLQGEVQHAANTTTGLNWENEATEADCDSTQSSGPSQPHIETPISCWNKYLEEDSENSCVKEEEDEDDSLIYTDREHFYTRRNITSAVRKRKTMPLHPSDFSRGTQKTSKKKRNYEEWSASTKKTEEPSCIKNENVSSTVDHGRIVSLTTDRPTCFGSKWGRDISAKEEVKGNISRTHGLQKNVGNMDPTLNNQNIGPSLWSALPKTSSHECQFPRPVHERRLLSDQLTGCAPKPRDDSSAFKPQCSIFQTDEDFDENY